MVGTGVVRMVGENWEGRLLSPLGCPHLPSAGSPSYRKFFFSFASKHMSPFIIMRLNSVCICSVSDSLQTASSMKIRTMSIL